MKNTAPYFNPRDLSYQNKENSEGSGWGNENSCQNYVCWETGVLYSGKGYDVGNGDGKGNGWGFGESGFFWNKEFSNDPETDQD